MLRLDVPAVGGVTPARAVQALAAERGVPVSLHVYPEVSIHLAPFAPGTIVEAFDPSRAATRSTRRTCSPPAARRFGRGTAVAPEEPGLGFELDWARFRP